MWRFLPEATVTSPLRLIAPVAVAKVWSASVPLFACVKSPYKVRLVDSPSPSSPIATVPYMIVAPPEPADPTVNALLSATVVAPLRAMAPVPVVRVLEPLMTTFPPSVFTPVEVLKVPELPEASKAPALSVRPLSTVRVGTCRLGNISLLVVPWLEEQWA